MTCVLSAVECLTPLGLSLDDSWDNLVKGRSGVGPLSRFSPEGQRLRGVPEIIAAAQLPVTFDALWDLGPKTGKWLEPGYLATALVIHRLMAQIEAAGGSLVDSPTAIIGATALGGQASLAEVARSGRPEARLILNQCQNVAGATVVSRWGLRGPSFSIEAACASSLQAILVAAALIEARAVPAALIYAHEFPVHSMGLAEFAWIGALWSPRRDDDWPVSEASRPFSQGRRGFVLGEGAGALLLASPEFARQRRLPHLATLRGSAGTTDCTYPTKSDTASIVSCIREALSNSGEAVDNISAVSAHATSTPVGDRAEAEALFQIFGSTEPYVFANKGQLGHALGAAGLLQIAIAAHVISKGLAPPSSPLVPDPELPRLHLCNTAQRMSNPLLLVNAFGFGGTNAAVVLGPP
jgi:3-oxoacyl-[acyl-carrier-protein] synthase II